MYACLLALKFCNINFYNSIQVEKLEAELSRWRQGETVNPDEQINLQELEAVTPVSSIIEEKPAIAVVSDIFQIHFHDVLFSSNRFVF